jgi:hypothetical protein
MDRRSLTKFSNISPVYASPANTRSSDRLANAAKLTSYSNSSVYLIARQELKEGCDRKKTVKATVQLPIYAWPCDRKSWGWRSLSDGSEAGRSLFHELGHQSKQLLYGEAGEGMTWVWTGGAIVMLWLCVFAGGGWDDHPSRQNRLINFANKAFVLTAFGTGNIINVSKRDLKMTAKICGNLLMKLLSFILCKGTCHNHLDFNLRKALLNSLHLSNRSHFGPGA